MVGEKDSGVYLHNPMLFAEIGNFHSLQFHYFAINLNDVVLSLTFMHQGISCFAVFIVTT